MKVETKVGLLAFVSIVLIGVFAYFMGFISPFSNTKELNVMFNYAGGIEEGSPVRVMGIKVGKVRSITFDPGYKMADGEEVIDLTFPTLIPITRTGEPSSMPQA
jgi:phospholipid/cholesterol/gamma-HCH transport system substrate-binding protein